MEFYCTSFFTTASVRNYFFSRQQIWRKLKGKARRNVRWRDLSATVVYFDHTSAASIRYCKSSEWNFIQICSVFFAFVQAVRQAATKGSMFLTSVVNVSTTIYHSFKSLLRRFDAFSGHGLLDHFPPPFFLPCCSLQPSSSVSAANLQKSHSCRLS